MQDKDNKNQDKTGMNPEKMDQQKVDQEIRKGAGSEDEQNAGNSSNKDIPENSNQSTGTMGSGQRQDSN